VCGTAIIVAFVLLIVLIILLIRKRGHGTKRKRDQKEIDDVDEKKPHGKHTPAEKYRSPEGEGDEDGTVAPKLYTLKTFGQGGTTDLKGLKADDDEDAGTGRKI